MTELNHTRAIRHNKLLELSYQILQTGNAREFLTRYPDFVEQVVPSDFILLFDALIRQDIEIQKLIILSNKVFNIFYQTLLSYNRIEPPAGTLLWAIEKNNQAMNELLDEIRPAFRLFLHEPANKTLRSNLQLLLNKLQLYTRIYTIKENVIFPAIEKVWPEFRCVQLMWAFHDEIRSRIQEAIGTLSSDSIDFVRFNRLIGDIFFYMKTIQFRDERILFPEIIATLEPKMMEGWLSEGLALGLPYFIPDIPSPPKPEYRAEPSPDLADLGTGKLTLEQIRLIFNHLPVDITYVDEKDEVRYFSTPPRRIFPRTVGIIGRNVKNCHPPDSVHIVEKIIESFRNGEKDKASFWIHMRGELIFIQYFAVRDEEGKYRGIIEVTQEISEIKSLEGEKRLLDW
ncbi:MAG: DUF438 domain-containing protein [Bacteroidales bacterium]|jgi:hypothetical protein|nr:DUF438 domain-containing protein [Bacteroidales bacterium]NPV37039.1 DUF438 domain-containing protein [Bacteroidales bacterium]